jgi:iron(III) transport system substrate-binding protein
LKNISKFVCASLFIIIFAAPSAFAAKQIWVYTSIYKEFAEPLKAAFEKKNPGIEAQIFQAGSEKIQAKVEAELVAKSVQADVILTSDPFWGHDLVGRGLALKRPGHSDDETNYYSLMVLIAHKDFPANKRPTSWQDLAKPEFKDLVQVGSPLESGTNFTTVAYLNHKFGWDYFKKLRDNNIASSGGNSTVIQKVESGEKKIGMVLLENALASQKRGSPIDIIYPSDGSIPIPSVQIIMKDSKEPDAAQKFADFVLSKEGQEILRGGFMYSVRKDVAAPQGAKPLKEVTKNSTAWSPQLIDEVGKDSKNIKKKFSQIVL